MSDNDQEIHKSVAEVVSTLRGALESNPPADAHCAAIAFAGLLAAALVQARTDVPGLFAGYDDMSDYGVMLFRTALMEVDHGIAIQALSGRTTPRPL